MNISKYGVPKDCGEDTKMNVALYCLLVYDLYKYNTRARRQLPFRNLLK